MKEFSKLVCVLTVICMAAGLLLAWVDNLTAGPIEKTERQVKQAAIKKVLPAYDNQPDTTTFTDVQTGMLFYLALNKNQFAGAAFETSSTKGYGGTIKVMVGVNAAGNIQTIEVLEQKETPGLGAKIKGTAFTGMFAGKSIKDTKWAVKKDRGDIDHITAATISSRAVVEAVKNGLDVYVKNETAIRAAAVKTQ